MAWVWEHGPADQSARFVLLALADFANDEGECWPSLAGIAAKVCMTDRGVRKVLRKLEDDGWVTTEIGGGRRACNIYRIARNPEPRSAFVPPKTRNHVPPGTTFPRNQSAETRNQGAQNPEHGSAEPSLTIIEPSEEKKDTLADEFEAAWRRYPRRVGKGAAEKAWRSARRKAALEAIAGPLAAFIAAVEGGEQRFIPHLATWLNQRRWEDDPGHAANRPRTSADDLDHLSAIRSTDDLAALMPPQLRIAR